MVKKDKGTVGVVGTLKKRRYNHQLTVEDLDPWLLQDYSLSLCGEFGKFLYISTSKHRKWRVVEEVYRNYDGDQIDEREVYCGDSLDEAVEAYNQLGAI